jgi:hypothetical protein
MKQFQNSVMRRFLFALVFCFILIISFIACRKSNDPFRESADPSFYSSDVLDKWLTLEVRLYKNATGINNGAFARPFAYSGIAALESLGQDDYSFQASLNGLTALPKPEKFKSYFWPASVNASLAEFNRSFFTSSNLTPPDLSAIDSLESAISNTFIAENASVINRSAAFGKSIATDIFSWSQTDKYKENNAMPYTLIVGPGAWQLTPPAFAAPAGPFWGNDRPIISGSQKGTLPEPPIQYSEDPTSAFYKMAGDVYAASKVLTADQKAMALFWRDAPGVTTPGHWLSILRQVIEQTNSHLDKACYAYALAGICANEARISVFETKYTYNLIRPVTYVRLVFQDTAWLPFIATPSHPEYISAHAVVSKAISVALETVFGDIGSFTDHTYDYLAFAPRSFNSFQAIAEDAGNSRFYGGIHFQPSIDLGIKEGQKVAFNVLGKLQFYPNHK